MKKPNHSKVSLFPAPPEAPGAALYTHYVISCVCPRLLLQSNLEQPTARHELNEIGK